MSEQGPMPTPEQTGISRCRKCGRDEELRGGFCFDCATAGEIRSAKRTVFQHIGNAIHNICIGNRHWLTEFQWAWERMTKTGDYSKDGYFDSQGIDWRQP